MGGGCRLSVHTLLIFRIPVAQLFSFISRNICIFSFTTSPDEGSIVIDYLNEEGHLARVHDETFDRGDGSIAVRYRIFASHKKLFVHVLNSEREHIAASPYMLENVHPEDCFCPVPLDSFKTSYQCPDGGYEQIDSDLSRFGDVNLTASIPETIKRFSDERGGCFAHYSIVSGKVSQHVTSIITNLPTFKSTVFWCSRSKPPGMFVPCKSCYQVRRSIVYTGTYRSFSFQ